MGRHKLLLDAAGEPLVRRAARALLACDLGGVLVVLGRDPENVRAALAGLACAFVVNVAYARGELPSSIALALAALPDDAPGALLALADMPFVSEAHLRRILEAADGTRAVFSVYGDVTAPPHLIPRHLFGQVRRTLQDGKPRPLPRALGDGAVQVAQPAADLLDVDDEQTYQTALTRLRGGS